MSGVRLRTQPAMQYRSFALSVTNYSPVNRWEFAIRHHRESRMVDHDDEGADTRTPPRRLAPSQWALLAATILFVASLFLLLYTDGIVGHVKAGVVVGLAAVGAADAIVRWFGLRIKVFRLLKSATRQRRVVWVTAVLLAVASVPDFWVAIPRKHLAIECTRTP